MLLYKVTIIILKTRHEAINFYCCPVNNTSPLYCFMPFSYCRSRTTILPQQNNNVAAAEQQCCRSRTTMLPQQDNNVATAG